MRRKNKIIFATITFAIIMLTGCSSPEKAGVKAMEQGDYEEAKIQFEKAIQDAEGADAAEAYRGLALTYYEQKNYEAALEAFQKAADLGAVPTVQSYNMMGICAIQIEDYTSALEYINSALSLSDTTEANKTDDSMIREMEYNQVVCYEKTGDWENARKKADEYLVKYPDDEQMKKEVEFLKTR